MANTPLLIKYLDWLRLKIVIVAQHMSERFYFFPPQRSLSPRSLSPSPSPEVRLTMFNKHYDEQVRGHGTTFLHHILSVFTTVISDSGTSRTSTVDFDLSPLNSVLLCVSRRSPGIGWRTVLREVPLLFPAEPTAHTLQHTQPPLGPSPPSSTSTGPVRLFFCSLYSCFTRVIPDGISGYILNILLRWKSISVYFSAFCPPEMILHNKVFLPLKHVTCLCFIIVM